MPQVPRYGPLQVESRPLPHPSPGSGGGGGRAPVSAAALGAGLERSKIARFDLISSLSQNVANIGLGMLQQQREDRERVEADANHYAVMKGDNQIGLWLNERMNNPDTGVLATRGEAAFPLPEIVKREYDELTGEIVKGLGNDAQRADFERVRMLNWTQIDHDVRSHVRQQMTQARDAELQAFLANRESTAIRGADNPRLVAEQLERVTVAIQTHGPALGWGTQVIAQEVEKARSTIHVGVIGTLLDGKQVGAAKVYFEETRDQISGDAIGKIEAALKAGDNEKLANQIADAASDPETGNTLAKATELIRDQIQDPDVRRLALASVTQTFAIREKDAADHRETQLRGVYDVLDRTKDWQQISKAVWADLSGDERSAAMRYSAALAKEQPIETDLTAYYGLLRKAGDNPNAFGRENLLTYRAKLSEQDFQELARLQLSIRAGEHEKTAAALDGFLTKSQIVDDTLVLYGIDPNAKAGTPEAAAIATLRRMLDRRVDAAQRPDTVGKRVKATNQEIRQTLDDLLSIKTPDQSGSWWNFWPGGKPFWNQPGKRAIDLTIDDVPTATRKEIKDKLTSKGLPSTDPVILGIYQESLVK